MAEVPLVIIEISHADITTLRFVNNYTNVTSNGNVYTAYPFDINLPSDVEEKLPQVTLTIDNISRSIVDEIRTLTGAPDIDISVILASDPDKLEAGPYEMKLREVGYNAFTITGTISELDIFHETYPGDNYSPTNFQGLFAGV